MSKLNKTRDGILNISGSKIYFSILIDQLNWFFFEQYVYDNGGIHVPLAIDDVHTVQEKIINLGGGNVVYVDAPVVEKWLTKNKLSAVNVIKSKLIFSNSKTPVLSSLRAKEDYASILFSSGSQNSSKAVLLTHGNQNLSFHEFSKSIIFNDCKTYLNLLSHSFSGGRKVFYAAILADLRIVSMDRKRTIVENLSFAKPDLIACVPFMLEEILEHLILYGNTFGLKKIISGGAHLDDTHRAEFAKYGIIVYNVYGLTETASLCSFPLIDDYKTGSAGTISDKLEFKLSKSNELLIKGGVVAMGYIENGNLIPIVDKNGYFNTKDVVEIDTDRNLFIKGRMSSIVKTNKGKFVNLEQFIGFTDFLQQNISLHCLTLDEIRVLAISDNILTDDLEQIKKKLRQLNLLGVTFGKVCLYKHPVNYSGKPSKELIFNNIVKEIIVDEC